jgi:hypothetical protein
MSEEPPRVDRFGLKYSVRAGRVSVHYPRREGAGVTGWGAGFEIPFPFSAGVQHEVTQERTTLIVRLLRVQMVVDHIMTTLLGYEPTDEEAGQ